MTGQFAWTYYEVYLHRPMPDMFAGDIVYFLRGIPMMAALALRPHRKLQELRLRFSYLDFVLLLVWWTFLYVYAVLPWMYATPSLEQYNFAFNAVTNIQNIVIGAGSGDFMDAHDRSMEISVRQSVWSGDIVHADFTYNQCGLRQKRILHWQFV